MRRQFLRILVCGLGFAASANADLARLREAAVSASFVHAREYEAARLEEFFDRLVNPTADRSCKYASSIAHRPPPGKVYLTFDDGPDPYGSEVVMKVLRKYGIPATFFMMGKKAEKFPDLLTRISRAGHTIVGNHSYSHANFHTLGPLAQISEVARTDDILGNLQSPRLFRYPYGNSSCEGNRFIRGRGYRIVGWHIDSCDWAFDATGTVSEVTARICEVKKENRSRFVDHVVSSVVARHGGIILMHDVHPNTIDQLEKIVDRLRERGFAFGALDEPEIEPSLF